MFDIIWGHYDVTVTSYYNFTYFGDFGHNSLTSAKYQVKIYRWKPFLTKDQRISYKMRVHPVFYLFWIKSSGHYQFGPIREQYPSP